MTPKRLFGTLAIAEAITWTLLLLGMFLKYVTQTTDALVSLGGGVHGFVFLAYCVVVVLVWVSQKWTWRQGLTGLASAVIPYATIPFERWATKKGLLAGPWRLGSGGAAPRGFAEHIAAWMIRRPVLAVIVALIAVTIVYVALLMAGPPIPAGE